MNTKEILNQIKEKLEGKGTKVSHLANISSIIFDLVPNLNWAGFYILEEDGLYLGPFQGKSAVAFIDVNNGVCGRTVRENKTIIENDVHNCTDHIACDLSSRSEIVTPIYNKDNSIYAVLDIDSSVRGNFTDEHKELFESVSKLVTTML